MERSDRTLSPRKVQLAVRSRFAKGKLRAAVAVVGEPDIAQGSSAELELFHYHLGKTVPRRQIRRLPPGPSRKVQEPFTPPRTTSSRRRASVECWGRRHDFGRTQAEWLPYWRNAEYVKTSAKAVKVSLYQHPDNGVLAVVSNLSSAKVSADVRFELARLGLSGKLSSVSDAMTGGTLRATKGKITCRLGALDWKLVRLEPKQ